MYGIQTEFILSSHVTSWNVVTQSVALHHFCDPTRTTRGCHLGAQ